MLIKVLSYNIHKGFGAGPKRFILDLIREALRTVESDLVFLQEVVGSHSGFKQRFINWPTQTQFEYLANEMWPHHAYGKNAIYDAGHHGNAILSRFPITAYKNFDLSIGKGEPRGMLHCSISEPLTGFTFDCFCTHLGLIRRSRAEQCLKMCQTVAERTGCMESVEARPVVIAGDFNDWEKRACNIMEKGLRVRDCGRSALGQLQKTFPSFFPLFALDRIYTRGFKVRKVQVLRGRPWSKLSDHAPLYAELEIETVQAKPAGIV